MRRPIFLLGARRSGTTLLWDTLRRSTNIECYDEPFHPALAQTMPNNNSKGTWGNFARLYIEAPEEFDKRFAPITPESELARGLSNSQKTYIRWLVGVSDSRRVLLESVRAGFKLRSLHTLFSDSALVHLHRTPEAFATAHLLPSGHSWRRTITNLVRKASFWIRRYHYNYWRLEEIIGDPSDRQLSKLLETEGYNADTLLDTPAVGKLLAYWMIHFKAIEETGRALFGDRFMSIRYENICDSPKETIAKICQTIGCEPVEQEYDYIRQPRGPFQPESDKWREVWREIGMLEERLAIEGRFRRRSGTGSSTVVRAINQET